MTQTTGPAIDPTERRAALWQRLFGFLALGAAVGAPAAQVFNGFRFLPGGIFDTVIATPIVMIGIIGIARLVLAPLIDALDPPVTGRFGRRTGWTVLLIAVLIALAIVVLAIEPTGADLTPTSAPVFFALVFLSLALSGGLLAAVDGLRSAQPRIGTQGALAAAQYLGTVIAIAAAEMVGQRAGTLTLGAAVCGLLVLGCIGLWLLPGREPAATRLLDRPAVERVLAGAHNLSRGGTLLVAWLYGVFVCPVADFFQRFGRLWWAILLILVVGDLGANFSVGRLGALFVGNEAYLARLQAFQFVQTGAPYVGAVASAIVVLRLGPIKGLAAALAFVAAALIAALVAIMTAPAMTAFLAALGLAGVAEGAVLVGFAAFVARLVSPAFAAFQFSVLWIIALPTGVITGIQSTSTGVGGPMATAVLFLVLIAVAIALTVWLGRQLDKTASDDG